MSITLSAIKADVGSIGGHTRPSDEMLEEVRKHLRKQNGPRNDKEITVKLIKYLHISLSIL
jgi:fructose 1,6-bisphosphatase